MTSGPRSAGAVVENTRLGAVLSVIEVAQAERDRAEVYRTHPERDSTTSTAHDTHMRTTTIGRPWGPLVPQKSIDNPSPVSKTRAE